MTDIQPNKIQLRFKSIRKHFDIGQVEFAKKTGLTQSQVSEIESGKRNITPAISLLLEDNLNIDRKWLMGGDGDMFKNIEKESEWAVKTDYYANRDKSFDSNGMLIGSVLSPEETKMTPLGNNQYGITVPLLPVKAYAGYLDNYGDPEYFETLAKHNVTVVGNHQGFYMAFAVKGKSMENWTSEEMAKLSIPEDCIVTGRDLPRHHWRNKLHLHRWEMYIIVHKEGIIIKQVIEHNVENGWIMCHSLNPDKNEFPDRKIFFDDCLQILNVVNKQVAL